MARDNATSAQDEQADGAGSDAGDGRVDSGTDGAGDGPGPKRDVGRDLDDDDADDNVLDDDDDDDDDDDLSEEDGEESSGEGGMTEADEQVALAAETWSLLEAAADRLFAHVDAIAEKYAFSAAGAGLRGVALRGAWNRAAKLQTRIRARDIRQALEELQALENKVQERTFGDRPPELEKQVAIALRATNFIRAKLVSFEKRLAELPEVDRRRCLEPAPPDSDSDSEDAEGGQVTRRKRGALLPGGGNSRLMLHLEILARALRLRLRRFGCFLPREEVDLQVDVNDLPDDFPNISLEFEWPPPAKAGPRCPYPPARRAKPPRETPLALWRERRAAGVRERLELEAAEQARLEQAARRAGQASRAYVDELRAAARGESGAGCPPTALPDALYSLGVHAEAGGFASEAQQHYGRLLSECSPRGARRFETQHRLSQTGPVRQAEVVLALDNPVLRLAELDAPPASGPGVDERQVLRALLAQASREIERGNLEPAAEWCDRAKARPGADQVEELEVLGDLIAARRRAKRVQTDGLSRGSHPE